MSHRSQRCPTIGRIDRGGPRFVRLSNRYVRISEFQWLQLESKNVALGDHSAYINWPLVVSEVRPFRCALGPHQ